MSTHKEKAFMEVINLRLKFPGETSLVFKDISFTVSKGEKVLLLGPSGCGKSTLLQVLSGIIPHSIEVPLKYDSIQHPESWGFVFQDPDTQFCMPYVDEELAFVLENLHIHRNKMDDLIKDVLVSVGLQDIEVHTSIQNLSQGMKQRLALASVLLLQPDVLFLDEPSALLDPEGTIQIWDAVKQVAADKTVLIVEHKIDHIADWVDRVVLFGPAGDIIANGSPKSIFELYQSEIDEYGIWYPEVWNDYLKSPEYIEIKALRQIESVVLEPIINLRDFKGYRGKDEKINIPKAHIPEGSWITIIGDNGAGKSTFLLSLIHLIQTTGYYELSGKEIDLLQRKKRPPTELSLVFQNPELQFITNTLFDEIAFSYRLLGLPETEVRSEVTSLLKLFQLDVNELRHPFQLSIGQKRRLSVATAFAQGSAILLLDEPTFGQDARNTFILLEKLEQLRKNGATIVMVTHDMEIVESFATIVWKIDKGQLIHVETLQEFDLEEQRVNPIA
ncbi:ABC transporter ATP-binding protein [Sporosarcina sp. FA9]|uniref:ABC transporter ATP-binding protein n=1 Tax=Sporosarcina sp. FA9 TaxID=3413030 RepID=UPI003F6551B0